MEQQKNTNSIPILIFIVAGVILLAVFGVYLVSPSSSNKTEETKHDTTSTQATVKTPPCQIVPEKVKDGVNKKSRPIVVYNLTFPYFLKNYWKSKAVGAAVIALFMALYTWNRFGSVSALSVFIITFICCYIILSRLLERWDWVDLSFLCNYLKQKLTPTKSSYYTVPKSSKSKTS